VRRACPSLINSRELSRVILEENTMTDTWDLWFPGAGASGLPFCRAKISAEAGGKVLVHAAPPELDVTVSGQDGTVLARGRR